MINYIYIIIIVISILFAVPLNNLEEINKAILESPKKSLDILVGLGVQIVLWNGILEISIKSGILNKLTRIIQKILKPLFKKANKEALFYISGNVASNMLGLGSTSIPLGIKAMEELDKINEKKGIPSKEMITLLILNTSGLTLVPTTILSIRNVYDAKINFSLMPIIMISSIITCLAAVMIDYIVRIKK